MGLWDHVKAWEQNERAKDAAHGGALGRFKADMRKSGAEMREVFNEPRPETYTTKHRIGAGTHSIHATLTVCTCGAWAPVWILHALLKRGKSTTR